MNISIQPLDSHGQPCGAAHKTTFVDFLLANDGFSIIEATDMKAILEMGSGYLIGGGAQGEYRLQRVKEEIKV